MPDDELETLVERWLTLPEVADLLQIDVRRVRPLLRDRQLVAVRRVPRPGASAEACVPELLLLDGHPLPELLADAGFSEEDTLRWLFTPDPSLPGSPIEALRSGRKTEIRRRAQALAF